MATPILKVITQYCAVLVDDEPMNELATEDTALYARRMWGYLQTAIPLFNSPATMQEYLLGTETNPKLIEPTTATYTEITTTAISEEKVINLGDSYIGYELFNCRLQTYDDFGNIILTPTDIVAYNANDGTITITPQTDDGVIVPIPAGTIFDMDFYKDGYFTETLTPEMMNILGMCFQCVWQDRFNTDWISIVSKVEDKSFAEQNRANKMKADTERLRELRTKLAEELRKFEQNLAYKKTVPSTYHLI